MSIFRRRSSDRTDDPDLDVTDVSTDTSPDPASESSAGDAPDPEAADADPEERRPFDHAEVDGLEGRLDLGSLWLSGIDGMELRLEIDQANDRVIAAQVAVGPAGERSQAQFQVFAAPKTSGIWRAVRDEIAQGIVAGGGTADEVAGPFGPELATRMPTQGPGGKTVFAPARFIGVDGPRWFFRAVLSGQAALDEAAAEPLLGLIRTSVVVRGADPMAPREVLPLKLPQIEQAAVGDPEEEAPDLNPFERGPEITEIH